MNAQDDRIPELEAARAAAAADPADADLQLRLAVELAEARDPETAAAIVRATELAPGDPAILSRAAILSIDTGDPQAARQFVHRAYAHAEPGWAGVDWLTYVLGRVMLSEGNADDARALLQASFDGEPGNRYFGEALARHLLESGLYAEAQEVAAGAIAAGADHPALPALLEQIEQIRAAAQALDDCERSGDLPARADAALALGQLLGRIDVKRAQGAYEIALGATDPAARTVAAFNLAGLVRESDGERARELLAIARESPDPTVRELASAELSRL